MNLSYWRRSFSSYKIWNKNNQLTQYSKTILLMIPQIAINIMTLILQLKKNLIANTSLKYTVRKCIQKIIKLIIEKNLLLLCLIGSTSLIRNFDPIHFI